MHPDDIIAGLRRELERLDKNADDYEDRKKAIDAEIVATNKQDRPEVEPEEPDTVVDLNISYLAGLKRELERVGEETRDQILAEIKRVEKLIKKEAADVAEEKPAAGAEDAPSAEEIEQRKQTRSGRRVERAVNNPVPEPAPSAKE